MMWNETGSIDLLYISGCFLPAALYVDLRKSKVEMGKAFGLNLTWHNLVAEPVSSIPISLTQCLHTLYIFIYTKSQRFQ